MDEGNNAKNGDSRQKDKGPQKLSSPSSNIKNKNYAISTNLPVVLNINPRSVYNKVEKFKEFIEVNDVNIICMSESWEREDTSIEKLLNLEKYEIISNSHQRRGKGGRPVLIVNRQKYHLENLRNSLVNIPLGVEVVWA